jgi:hypothetical protein
MIRILKMILLLVVLSINVNGQKKRHRVVKEDTLTLIRQFIHVCNVYKQVPLYLDLEIYNTTNFITGPEDTTRSQAEFYMLPGSSYIRLGEVEQLVDDSMALLVSDKIQKMILYSNAQPVIARMKMMMGLSLPDSSILELAKKYKAQAKLFNDTIAIELVSRIQLYGSVLPKETIEVQYEPKTKKLFRVITTKRTLIPLEQSDFNNLKAQPGLADKLIVRGDSAWYLVKEQAGTFVYKKIEHEKNMILPATITKRVGKNNQGEFVPVKGYEEYTVIIN